MELRKNIHFVLFAVLLSLMKEGIRKGGYAFRIKRGGIIDAEERSIVMKKQIVSAIISAVMALTLLAGCGGSSSGSSGSAAPAADASDKGSKNKYEMAYVLSTKR